MVATRRSGSRSTVTFTLFTSGVFTLFRYRRLNLSPQPAASTIGAGIGMSPEACMVESEMLPAARSSPPCRSAGTWLHPRNRSSSEMRVVQRQHHQVGRPLLMHEDVEVEVLLA